MKVKYFIIIIFVLLYSCDQFDYTSEKNDPQYITSNQKLEEAVTGAYARFAGLFTNGLSRNSFIYPCIFADDIELQTRSECEGEGCDIYYDQYNIGIGFRTITDNGDSVYLREGCRRYYGYQDYQESWESDYIEHLTSIYRNTYKAIISQNFIINQVDDLTDLDETHQRLLGEVFYMRAYSYFRLVRIFGNIPLITDTDVSYQVSYASFESIYGLIESDLKQALSLLPVSDDNNGVSSVCPNRGSVKALLAEVYLTMGGFPLKDPSKYELAARYAREVIDSASVYGFGITEDFADLYTWEFLSNEEMVSAVQYKSDYGYEDLENLGHIHPVFNSNELVWHASVFYGETKFYNEYPRNYRKEMTFEMEQEINTEWDTITGMIATDTIIPLEVTTCYPVRVKKSNAIYYDKYYEKEESYTVYILRYAHTLLTYAEASARSGNIDEMSYEAVNMVRRRANKLPVNTPSVYDLTQGLSTEEFIDSVVWERAWEFVGEVESRWFDLVRLEMINNLDELRDPYAAPIPFDFFENGNYFFPIPQEDLYLNPNLAGN